MQPARVVREVTVGDAVAAVRFLACALGCTLLLGLFAGSAFLALLLPLAVLATLDPTLTFGGVPSTQYPPVYLGVQAVWTVLFGLGLRTTAQTIQLPPASTGATELPDRYPSTPRNERVAGLIKAVDPDERD